MDLTTIDGWNSRNIHFSWKPDVKEIATVSDGDTFRVRIPDSSTLQVQEDWSTENMKNLDPSRFDAAVGPIRVEGAEKGDALEVDILAIETAGWGWTALQPDFGLLRGRFENRMIIWRIEDGTARTEGEFLKGVRINTNPFLGVIGLAPQSGEFGMIPPQYFGGNMDNHLLIQGSELLLPVSNNGAMLSVSDPHASQGDGEVCGTAIETSATATLKVKVHKSLELKYPRATSPFRDTDDKVVAMGISGDLKEASVLALDNMIELLGQNGYSDAEAYALMSVAGDLRISEIVDEPHYVVSATLATRYAYR